jgi:hypothetical protein
MEHKTQPLRCNRETHIGMTTSVYVLWHRHRDKLPSFQLRKSRQIQLHRLLFSLQLPACLFRSS